MDGKLPTAWTKIARSSQNGTRSVQALCQGIIEFLGTGRCGTAMED
jgi:hypothetical protein